MPLPVASFKTLLLGFAFSPTMEANLMEAMRLSHFLGSELILLHAGRASDQKSARVKEQLERSPGDPSKISVVWREGKPVEVLLAAAREFKVDLLLLGAQQHEHGYRFYMGSIARKLTRNIHCSVLLFIKPSVERVPCQHIVVNGLDTPDTPLIIGTAFKMAQVLGAKQITVVEEIQPSEISVSVEDDRSLKQATLLRQRIQRQENSRVQRLLAKLPENFIGDIAVKSQPIFGKRGSSIGHYAEVVRADLLIMNAAPKSNLMDRIFPHDIEYILSDLPTDLLIVRAP